MAKPSTTVEEMARDAERALAAIPDAQVLRIRQMVERAEGDGQV